MRNARWWVVGLVGVGCGALLGWLLVALTGSEVLGLIAFVVVASILVVLSVQGMRQNRVYRMTAERATAARARRARVERAMRESRGEEGG